MWRLAGVRNSAHAMATGTGLYDPTRCDWDDELLALCSVRREQLLELHDGPVAGRPAPNLKALDGALWCAAIGDGAASNLGSGADRPGTVAINLGSSAAVRAVRTSATAVSAFGLFAYRIDARRFLTGGAIF